MSLALRRAAVPSACALLAIACAAPKHGGESVLRASVNEAPFDATPAMGRDLPAPDDAVQLVSPDGGASAELDIDGTSLSIDAPTVLAALESSGVSLGAMLGAAGPLDNRALAAFPRYASLVSVLEADVGEIAGRDPRAGISVARSSHRLFDVRWLRSRAARFELVGIVNRLDRVGVIGGCGEIRLIYRLAYETEEKGSVIASRLPMTLSLELNMLADQARPATVGTPSRDAACRAAALRWFAPKGEGDGATLARWLVSERGPLFEAQRHPSAIRRVAVNMQSVRWPSTVRPDLGGHAEYVLRAFANDGAGRLVPAPLENTLDVARVRRGTPLFRKLLDWIKAKDNLRGIDEATIVLPDELSARRAVSVTPRGMGRQKNRPFSTVLRETDLAGFSFASTENAKSPAALLRRLDDLACPGCHQSRSVAGFHFLGVDRDRTAASNALASPFSPHFERDQRRRGEVLQAVRAQRAASYARPLAERARRGDSGYGAHCGLGDAGFAEWTCDVGYRCDRFDAPDSDVTVGICLPAQAGGVGDPCEVGPVIPSPDPLRDRVARTRTAACGGGAACNTNAVGFPGGMCTPSCDALSDRGACGRIAILDAFNACLAQRRSFEACIREHSSPAGLRRCSRDEPCRDDYICAGGGVCIPPYFVFQMRIDGHPAPVSR
jgi:hypothetical protein